MKRKEEKGREEQVTGSMKRILTHCQGTQRLLIECFHFRAKKKVNKTNMCIVISFSLCVCVGRGDGGGRGDTK